MDNRPIGIFDSGVGGLTAVKELIHRAPGESFVYFGDSLRAPYGDRTAEDIRFLSRRNARFLRACGVKALIVACNTSTANAMDMLLADNADIPVTGTVEPTAAAAVKASPSGRVAVLATAAVIRSGMYERVIRERRPDARVVSVSCPKLVPLIEAGRTAADDPALRAALEEYLAPVRDAGSDAVILGCTHYPIIREAVLSVLGREAALVDSGAACVGEILDALRERDGLAPTGAARSERFYCSGRRDAFTAVARTFLGRDVGALTQTVDISGV